MMSLTHCNLFNQGLLKIDEMDFHFNNITEKQL